VLTSASASTQTTILPTARTALSMARFKAIPEAFGRIHPRFLTPSVATLTMGAISALWTILVLALNPAQNVLGDSITALGFGICFYYGLTAFAAVVYFRREIFTSTRNLIFVGLVPLLGGLMMLGIFIKALTHYSQNKEAGELINYAKPIAGIEVPIAIGIGSLLLGVVVMLFAWPRYREFFGRRPEVAAEGTLEVPVEHAAAHL